MHELHERVHYLKYDHEVLDAFLSVKSYGTSARHSTLRLMYIVDFLLCPTDKVYECSSRLCLIFCDFYGILIGEIIMQSIKKALWSFKFPICNMCWSKVIEGISCFSIMNSKSESELGWWCNRYITTNYDIMLALTEQFKRTRQRVTHYIPLKSTITTIDLSIAGSMR